MTDPTRRYGILGLALPYIVSVVFILAFKSIVGHAGDTATPLEWSAYRRVVVIAAWVSVVLSFPLTLPHVLGIVKRDSAISVEPRPGGFGSVRLALAYVALIVVNGLMSLLWLSVAWMLLVREA